MEIFKDEFVPNIEGHPYHPKWIRANQVEAAKWAKYRDDLLAGKKPTPPAMASKYGKALIAGGKMSVTDIGGGALPPPGILPWSPPTLQTGAGRVDWVMTNANRMNGTLLSGGGRDLVITNSEVLVGPVQQLNGWRNIVWIGGSIDIPSGGNPLATETSAIAVSATGTVHLEGINIQGIDASDNIVSRGGSSSGIIQVQNCRLNAHFKGGSGEHADCFQTQGNAQISQLRFALCTLTTDYQGFFLRPPDAASFVGGGTFDRINFRRRNIGSDPAQAWVFIADEDPDQGHPTSGVGNISMNEVWAEGSPSSGNWIFYPSWLFEGAFTNPSQPVFGNRQGVFRSSDATGNFVRPSTTSDVVPPGGPASGQACLPAGWSGIIRFGIPPAGDFCPVGTPGLSYASPGYA
jgi:hypothetical protein